MAFRNHRPLWGKRYIYCLLSAVQLGFLHAVLCTRTYINIEGLVFYKGQDTRLYVLENMDEDEPIPSYDSRIYSLAGFADEPLQPGRYITAC